jgi:hypothetical protein
MLYRSERSGNMSDVLARTLTHRGVHYGWVVAGIGFMTMLTTSAAQGIPGVLCSGYAMSTDGSTGE